MFSSLDETFLNRCPLRHPLRKRSVAVYRKLPNGAEGRDLIGQLLRLPCTCSTRSTVVLQSAYQRDTTGSLHKSEKRRAEQTCQMKLANLTVPATQSKSKSKRTLQRSLRKGKQADYLHGMLRSTTHSQRTSLTENLFAFGDNESHHHTSRRPEGAPPPSCTSPSTGRLFAKGEGTHQNATQLKGTAEADCGPKPGQWQGVSGRGLAFQAHKLICASQDHWV